MHVPGAGSRPWKGNAMATLNGNNLIPSRPDLESCLPLDPAQRVTGETPIVRHNEIKKSVTVVQNSGKAMSGKRYIMPLAGHACHTEHNTIKSIHREEIRKNRNKVAQNCPICPCPSETVGSILSSNYSIWHNLKPSRIPPTTADESIYIVRTIGVAACILVRG